jgi:hypothetical protein
MDVKSSKSNKEALKVRLTILNNEITFFHIYLHLFQAWRLKVNDK